MTGNAAQVDFVWERPQQSSFLSTYMQSNGSLRDFCIKTAVFKPKPPVRLDVLGFQVNWTPDGRDFPEPILEVISQLYCFAALEAGWDSYGSNALNHQVIGPVLQLVFAGHHRGNTPRLTPLNRGGIGLRWEADHFDVDVDVHSDDSFEITTENLETGEIDETSVSSVDEVRRLIESLI